MMEKHFADQQYNYKHMLYQFQKDIVGFDARPGYEKIRLPVLLIAGRHDAVPVAKMEHIRDGLPDAKLIVFENSGHFASLEEPERFEKTVAAFIQE